jgi:hypothetical protein
VERPYVLSVVEPRRIVATASRWRRREQVVAVVCGVWFVVVAVTINVLPLVLDPAAAKTAGGGVFIGACAVLVVFLLYAYATKPLVVDVGPDGVTLDEGRRGVFPAHGVRAGEWRLSRYEVVAGTALHLSAGKSGFVLGGRDHRPLPGLRLDAPLVYGVDGYASAAELDVLLAALPMLASPARAGTPAGLRCVLVPNLGLFGQRLAVQPLVLELEPQGVRILDAMTGAVLAACPRGSVRATPVKHTYRGRGGYTMPMLVLQLPQGQPITLGIPDFRFSWAGDAAEVGAGPYIVGGADWLPLVEWVGLAPRLVVGKD